MRKISIKTLAAAALLTGASMATSCTGSSARQNLQTDVEMVNQKLSKDLDVAGVASDFKLGFNDSDVVADMSFNSDLVNVDDLNDDLVKFVLALYLKAPSADGKPDSDVLEMVNNLAHTGDLLMININGTNGDRFADTLKPEELKYLYKTPLGDLNRSAVAASLARQLAPWAEKTFRTAEASDFSCTYDINQITIDVVYASLQASPLKDLSNPAGVLKAQLLEQAKAHFARFGSLTPAVFTLMENAGIKNLRLSYHTPEGKTLTSIKADWADLM